MREQLKVDRRTEEVINKLKKRKDNVWREWWETKKELTRKFLIAVKENNQQEAEKYLSPEKADMRVDPDVKDDKGFSAMHYAAMIGNSQLLLTLLKNDASIDIQTSAGATPLILAAQK